MHAVFKAEDLFQKRKPSSAELHQSAKLYELLPSRANALWQSDVTYIHIPGHGWWYAVTVIDYYSRYLLALHLTPSYAAPEINTAIDHARAEAERCTGLGDNTVSGDRQRQQFPGEAVSGAYSGSVSPGAYPLPYPVHILAHSDH